MAQAGYTPISLYYSTTAAAVPTAGNLVQGELAINIADGKLYFENSSGVVTLLAQSGAASPVTTFQTSLSGLTPSTATTGAITLAGTLGATSGGTGLTSFSLNGLVYASTTTALATSSALSFDGTNFATTGSATASRFVPSGATVATNGMYLPAATSLGFSTNSVERMRIDSSGNIGIGTSSPTAQVQIAGSSSTSALKVPNIEEVVTASNTAATGTINYDITTQSVLYYTANASGNWTVNFRGSSTTTLNALMQDNESMSVTFLVQQGSTAYYNSSVQIDGTTSGVTTEWQGGTAPTSGNASSIDSYTYVIIKTASATYTVLASQTKFA
jgi:hypothetical protein